MPKKHIIIISTMLIVGLGFFVTMWILSHRTNKRAESKDTSKAAAKVYSPQSRFSPPRKVKDVASKKIEITKSAEETIANDSRGLSDVSESSSVMADSSQDGKSSDSLTSQTGTQNDEVSQALENAAKCARLKESFLQIQNLCAQSESITDELTGLMSSAGTGKKIDGDEYGKKLDERNALDREVLAICREAQKIAPDAIQIKLVSREWNELYNFHILTY
jgi:hypothetical protein